MDSLQTSRFDLPDYSLPWQATVLFIVLTLVAILSFYEQASMRTGYGMYASWTVNFMFLGLELMLVSSLFIKRRRYLLANNPPLLIYETQWFGAFTHTSQKKLEDSAWVRAVYSSGDGSADLCIEIGTSGHMTTTICLIPYSQNNVVLAKVLTAEIARFLQLEDKGYALGGPR